MILGKKLKTLLCACAVSFTCTNALATGEVYKVASEPYFTPYTFKDERGNIIGFNKDIMDAIGEDQGFTVQFIEGAWPAIFDFVKEGKQDIVMSWIAKGNPVTKGFLDSDPYISVPKAGIAYLNDKLDINGVASLRDLRIGVTKGSSQEPYLRENNVNNIIEGRTLFELFRLTGQGQIDAFTGDRLVLEYMAKKFANRKYNGKNVQLKIKPLYDDQDDVYQPLIVSFRPGDQEIANRFNTGLKNIKKSGKYQEILTKWFGENAPVKY